VLDATARCIPLGSAPGHAYVWADDQPAAVPGRRFVEEVLKRLPEFRIDVPTDDQVQMLIAGQRLAFQIAPSLARSAISHLRTVVVGHFEGGQPPINALTVPGLSGVVLLSPNALSDSAAVAETLVHESVHLKFLDIEYVHPLFPIGFRPYTSPRITPIWHENDQSSGGWPIDRLLTSMHVYLSLAVFFGMAADRRGDDFYAPDDCAARVEKCRTRAARLFETAQDYLEYLSTAGREFVASIGVMLAELDASPAREAPTAARPQSQ
jgi:HEXXH motif-containing protein